MTIVWHSDVGSDAHKVVLKPDGPCFKSTSTNNSALDVKDANVNKVKTMSLLYKLY